jgi:hypothetical protein
MNLRGFIPHKLFLIHLIKGKNVKKVKTQLSHWHWF